MENRTAAELAKLIDHTLLKPEATRSQIQTLCAEARQYRFASVCVHPFWVSFCAGELAGTGVMVCTVAGFPLGATTPAVKAYEAEQCIAAGAKEVDMVLNIGALKSGEQGLVECDVRAVVQVAHVHGAGVKVIIEACLLTEEEKLLACQICKGVGADFVKTSTGFSSGGATVEDVALMRRAVGPEMGVKAAGGVRSYVDALKMIEAGASRIGTSAGAAILREAAG